MLSVEAVQVRLICELEIEEAARLPGAEGGWVSAEANTTKAGITEWDVDPLVPVTVNGKLPVGADAAVVMVNVVEPEVVTVAGLKAAAAPAGKPVTEKATDPEKPVPEVTVTVNEVLLPGATLWAEGVNEREKSGVTVTVRIAGLGSVRPRLSVTVSEAK